MKIISEIPDDSYLVKISGEELANVLGYYSDYADGFRANVRSLIKAETLIDASVVYRKHQKIKDFQDSKSIQEARNKLLVLLDALTPIENKVEKLAGKINEEVE